MIALTNTVHKGCRQFLRKFKKSTGMMTSRMARVMGNNWTADQLYKLLSDVPDPVRIELRVKDAGAGFATLLCCSQEEGEKLYIYGKVPKEMPGFESRKKAKQLELPDAPPPAQAPVQGTDDVGKAVATPTKAAEPEPAPKINGDGKVNVPAPLRTALEAYFSSEGRGIKVATEMGLADLHYNVVRAIMYGHTKRITLERIKTLCDALSISYDRLLAGSLPEDEACNDAIVTGHRNKELELAALATLKPASVLQPKASASVEKLKAMRNKVLEDAKKAADERTRLADPDYRLRSCINEVEVYFVEARIADFEDGTLDMTNPHALADTVFLDMGLLGNIREVHYSELEAEVFFNTSRNMIVGDLKGRLYQHFTGKVLVVQDVP